MPPPSSSLSPPLEMHMTLFALSSGNWSLSGFISPISSIDGHLPTWCLPTSSLPLRLQFDHSLATRTDENGRPCLALCSRGVWLPQEAAEEAGFYYCSRTSNSFSSNTIRSIINLQVAFDPTRGPTHRDGFNAVWQFSRSYNLHALYSAWRDFCRDSTLPVCNLFLPPSNNNSGYATANRGCELKGISLSNGRHLGNLERKQAAVGRREMQLFLVGYIIIEICEIFTVGEFPLGSNVRIAFTGIHLGMIVATLWILMLNAIVGYQILDDGTPMSLGLMVGSAAALFIGTGYIALDTGYNWTGHFNSSLLDHGNGQNRNIALYVLYQLAPLVFLVAFFVLETVLVIRVLGERKPMIYLVAAALLFALGQIFNYVVSVHICNGTNGKVDGALFETLFTLLSVAMVWIFWSSITEDDWPMPVTGTYS
ncbi:hypothetical protein B7494_g6759 [Chlorociboria aeruginascens]|nr:hypothetical protein B7494_g6759 [Chlorociboria aeruginascens]